MFVYLAEFNDFDYHYVVGVYSTREKAEKAISKDAKIDYEYAEHYIIRRVKIDQGIYEN